METVKDNLKEFIELCQEAYYQGNSIISDEEYDILIKRFPQAEEAIGPAGDVPHLFRMYSLQKVYLSRGDKAPDLVDEIETPKIDGCALSVLYINGKLAQILTRGNGIKGRDVTANARQLNIANTIMQKVPTQITGEVVVTKKVENMRNYASGAINLKDSEEFLSRIAEGGLVFVAYGIQCQTDQVGMTGTYAEDMYWLENQGFLSVTTVDSRLEWFPTDGVVVRTNSNNAFNRLGWTNKFPRGAYAVKEDEEGEVTTLLAVTWDVGKSGKVTPVGHFEEIVIDDAKIAKATLNNVGYIEALDLEIGCQIRVIRSGGVIPKIIERVYD
ncbi:putative NAD-dependent DNA ligase, subunit A [Erwinia phage KEY]|uniref:DNA ligase (NAD(+)) n=1 Tax=Erwinia phage KEY TaxID=2821255 RepID=A0AAE7WAX8_9CAUD|nr:putative NAD-dependent DNA ligase, subunit A [Erwinia phage KEY]